MPNGRCRRQPGGSTGPRTPKGLEAIRRTGLFTASTHAAPSSNDGKSGPRADCSLSCSINCAANELSTKQGPHRCGPAHFPKMLRLRLPLPPAPRTHAREADAEEVNETGEATGMGFVLRPDA